MILSSCSWRRVYKYDGVMFIPVAGSAEEAEDTAESVTLETCLSGLRYLLAKEAGCKKPREFESHRLRQKSKSHFEAESGSARSADTNVFPPKNPESERVRHAPRGSKSTVRASIIKFEPTFLNK